MESIICIKLIYLTRKNYFKFYLLIIKLLIHLPKIMHLHPLFNLTNIKIIIIIIIVIINLKKLINYLSFILNFNPLKLFFLILMFV